MSHGRWTSAADLREMSKLVRARTLAEMARDGNPAVKCEPNGMPRSRRRSCERLCRTRHTRRWSLPTGHTTSERIQQSGVVRPKLRRQTRRKTTSAAWCHGRGTQKCNRAAPRCGASDTCESHASTGAHRRTLRRGPNDESLWHQGDCDPHHHGALKALASPNLCRL